MWKKPLNWLAAASLVVVSGIPSLATAPPGPEVVPTCQSPQLAGPATVLTPAPTYPGFSAAWNGREYVVAYTWGGWLMTRRIYADGTPAAPPVSVAWGNYYGLVDIAWSGSRFGVVATGYDGVAYRPFFQTLDAQGALVSGPVSATAYTGSASAMEPVVAYGQDHFLVAWWDLRNSAQYDVFCTLFDTAGAVAGGGSLIDLAAASAPQDDLYADAAFLPSGKFLVAYTSSATGSFRIHGATVTTGGAVAAVSGFLVGTTNTLRPTLAAGPNAVAVVAEDYSYNAYSQLTFNPLNGSGASAGVPTRLTDVSYNTGSPRMLWTGGEFALFYAGGPSSALDAVYQRLSPAGASLSPPLPLTYGLGVSSASGASGVRSLVGFYHIYTGSGFAQSLACEYPMPPGCPEDLVAYGVTGTQATLAWLPAQDLYHDIAYYKIYRNGAHVGTTSSTVFTDFGLATGATYAYAVRTVNDVSLESANCPADASIYVKASGSLLLMVNKDGVDPDALLSWTDAGQGSYRVYRGTSPQVLQEITSTSGTTAEDPGALAAPVLYFYSVDMP